MPYNLDELWDWEEERRIKELDEIYGCKYDPDLICPDEKRDCEHCKNNPENLLTVG